jgi:4a-hydroxytetrahydrobiopterin dehydratase
MTAAPAKLTNFQIESSLTQLPGWTVVAGKLHREYRFPNFGKAFGFMKTAAPGWVPHPASEFAQS